jgi:uncharacterized RDD family membrane protein YckC
MTRPEPPPQTGTGTSNAGLGRRFAARLLDVLLVFLPVSLLLAVAGLPPPTFGLGGTEAWLHSAVTALLWAGYYIAFEGTTGATLGKRLLHLKVYRADGHDADITAAATRNLWLLLGLIPWAGGLLQLAAVIVIAVTIATDGQHRGGHDRLAGTIVTP